MPAGHWVQQEQPAEVVTLLMRFLEQSAPLSVGR
jgi:pimeloyl-ACP methyl ester carboxylesterase